MARYAAIHILDGKRDALFLEFAPRDGLWFRRFAEGDTVTCCRDCRRIFFEIDWVTSCPACGGPERLFVTRPNMLLATETVQTRRGTITRPMSAEKLTDYIIGGTENEPNGMENEEGHNSGQHGQRSVT